MIYTDQIDRAWEQGPVTIRALQSLTRQAFEAVSAATSNLPGRWTLERHDDYDGYLSVLISPEGDTNALNLLDLRQRLPDELAQFRGDELHTLGWFRDIEATIAELVRAMKLSVVAK